VALKTDVAAVKTDVAALKVELADFRTETRATFRSVDEHLAELRDLIIGSSQRPVTRVSNASRQIAKRRSVVACT
jgi:hypothetical protein